MASKPICNSPQHYKTWPKGYGRSNEGLAKNRTISGSPTLNYRWKDHGRKNS
jgi:hypothetical protein